MNYVTITKGLVLGVHGAGAWGGGRARWLGVGLRARWLGVGLGLVSKGGARWG